jgi:hypothetical protein
MGWKTAYNLPAGLSDQRNLRTLDIESCGRPSQYLAELACDDSVALACIRGKQLIIKDCDAPSLLQHRSLSFEFCKSDGHAWASDPKELGDQLMCHADIVAVHGEMGEKKPAPHPPLDAMTRVAEADVRALNQQGLDITEQDAAQWCRHPQAALQVLGGNTICFPRRLHDSAQRRTHSLQNDWHARHSGSADHAGPQEAVLSGTRLNADQPTLNKISRGERQTRFLQNLTLAKTNAFEPQIAQTIVGELPQKAIGDRLALRKFFPVIERELNVAHV